ncbi:UNVERIFIED_CONTAM: hypothetical protein GTU68_049499 [Idotea baltica]|nr:hypothetical protein [Idotea baltica]
MDFKQIKELIKLVNDTDLTEVSIEKEDYRLVIKSKHQQVVTPVANVVQSAAPVAMVQQPAATTVAQPVATPAPAKETTTPSTENDSFITIKSPMIGTFYRSPSPDKPVFVKVGDTIDVGTVLCLVEAMKLFNEIESEVSGKIVKILIDDSSPVEYDQPLFLVDPS